MMDSRLPPILPPDLEARATARARMDGLTKPRGSLGRLEEVAVQLAAIQGRPLPDVSKRVIVVATADHGVTAQGVSAYPSDVTRQMVGNFLAGRAAINVLARLAGAQLMVIDAGIREPVDDVRITSMRLGAGTADLSVGPAMGRETAMAAIEKGVELGRFRTDADVVVCGEMGIGNSTAASAVTAALLGLRANAVTGPGAGLDAGALRHKTDVIDAAIDLNQPDPSDAVDVLAKVGGFEIGVLAGVMIGSASRRRAVVLDGLISSSAALIASRLAAGVREYFFAGHLSTEPGHGWILRDLALRPLLDLGLRLGEGTGAALALPLLDAACRLLSEMATFEEAGVAGRLPGHDESFE